MNNLKKTLAFLPDRIKTIFEKIDDDCMSRITEIRVRKNSPIALKCSGKNFFLDEKGNLFYKPTLPLPIVSSEEMEESFQRLCRYSVYSHLDDIKKGFITLDTGDRVGFCGSAARENDRIISVKNITSFNIRIARQYLGVSDAVFEKLKHNRFGNVLIAGEPSSGKTTFLRDLARNLSENSFNVSVIDERQELFGEHTGFEKGSCMDVFCAYPKDEAIQTAVRTMSPDYIITDEIGVESECDAICRAINCGVNFALSIHCSDYTELKKKSIFKRIDDTKKFEYIVFLRGKENIGQISNIITLDER